MTRPVLTACAIVVGVVARELVRELGHALLNLADALDPGNDDPRPEKCPDYVPDALLVDQR